MFVYDLLNRAIQEVIPITEESPSFSSAQLEERVAVVASLATCLGVGFVIHKTFKFLLNQIKIIRIENQTYNKVLELGLLIGEFNKHLKDLDMNQLPADDVLKLFIEREKFQQLFNEVFPQFSHSNQQLLQILSQA